MSKTKQTLISADIEAIAVEQGVIENKFNWKLVRLNDGLTKKSKEVIWLEWNDDGSFKEKHDKPDIGRSLIMSPFNQFFTWQTTGIKEIIERKEDYIKFKTGNSIYELTRINNKDETTEQ
jgi:hypothetical protein